MRTIILLSCMSMCSFAHEQGAWNIRYVPVELCDSSLVGQEIRFDFKRSKEDTLVSLDVPGLGVRWLLGREDTVEVVVAGDKIVFIEKWKIYTDHGIVQDQYLESVSPLGIRIGRMTLLKIFDDRIYARAELIENGSAKVVDLEFFKIKVKGVLVKK